MKSIFNFAVVSYALFISTATVSVADGDPIRVACLGDSITAGARVDAKTESYPARLQKLLGDDYEVRNFGIGGATQIKTGRPNIWRGLEEVQKFQPHIAIISLGTNDTVGGSRKNWEQIERFEDDFTALVGALADLSTKPRIVLCTPTAMVLTTPELSAERLADLTVRKIRLQELCARVRKLATKHADQNVSLLELNPVLQDHPELLTKQDGVHPNAEGYLAIAKVVAAHIGRQAKPTDIIFRCDFESKTWWQEWDQSELPKRTETVATDTKREFEPHDGKALRIRVDQGGHYGVSLAYEFAKRIGMEPEEVYFRYYLRLADDWIPERGGKLPGIGGTYGRAGWGGRKVDGTDGWSARGLFSGQKDGRTPIGFYCYHADMRGKYGSHWVWDRDGFHGLENNRWYSIEQYVKMNTPRINDGVLRGWVDGKLVFEKTDVRMRDVDALKIETVWLNVYHGGTWTATANHHLYIDDVVISRNRIRQ